MKGEDIRGAYSESNSDRESIASDKKRSAKKSARYNIPKETQTMQIYTNNGDNEYVEITLDIKDDSVAEHRVQAADGDQNEDPELSLLHKKSLGKRTSSGSNLFHDTLTRIRRRSQEFEHLTSLSSRPPARRIHRNRTSSGSYLFHDTSTRIRKRSQEFEHLTSSSSRPPARRIHRNNSAVTHALKGLKFIATNTGSKSRDDDKWSGVLRDFHKLSINGLLSEKNFGKCIGMNKDEEFGKELFRALARRHYISGDLINVKQMKVFFDQISEGSFDSSLQIFIDMVDRDADGRITEEEVADIIRLSASTNRLENLKEQADEYAAFIMEELDPENKGYIMVENLGILLLQDSNQTVIETESSILSQMMSHQPNSKRKMNQKEKCYFETKYFLLDNWQRIWIMILWLGIVAALFVYMFIKYTQNKAAYEVMGYCVCTAKGAAETLKFNMALILLPVCRNTITWLRNKTKLDAAVPFDDNLNFHKVIFIGIGVGIVLHAGAHLTCDFPRILNASEEKYELIRPFFGEYQPQSYWEFVKGVEGVTGIIMMVLMVIAFVFAWFRGDKNRYLPEPLKKLTGFNAFWYSHHLFVIVYALLIVHGVKLYITRIWYQQTTWMYLAVPMSLYACERLIRAFRSSIKPVHILKVAVYTIPPPPGTPSSPSSPDPTEDGLLALRMSKPQGFKYKSGQYMFVKFSDVSPFEWHPFSISSAPGDDYLGVHIKTLGDWTRRVKTLLDTVCKPPPGDQRGPSTAEFSQENNTTFLKVSIDGPYGAPAQDYEKYEVVLLIGLGIGATPMVSIVKDIINNNIERDDIDLHNAMENGRATPQIPNSSNSKSKHNRGGFKTRKAYFYWLTGEYESFEWFKGMMNEVAEMDDKGVIEMHNHCTSVYAEGDARSAIIAMLQSLYLAKNGVDVVSGTKVKSHFARPVWHKVYKNIALHHPHSRVGVFYCGRSQPIKELKHQATKFSHCTSTKFDFHRENF